MWRRSASYRPSPPQPPSSASRRGGRRPCSPLPLAGVGAGVPGWGVRGLLSVSLAAVLLTACYRQQMGNAPRYDPLEPSALFADGQSARQPVPDTVARGHLHQDSLLDTGMENGQPSDRLPFPASREVLDRGRDRFDIYCAPCHGRTGYGNGMVVQRGFIAPPSFHSDELRAVPVGHIFDVETQGLGAMPSYAAQIPVRDRWDIAAYIRALQLSQHADASQLPDDLRQQLEAQP
jgi:mono/diheme cytochrome c family protein